MDAKKSKILTQQLDADRRVAQHEQQQNQYYEYRRELERLRARNKELNVKRQRRKDKYIRETYAARVQEKDAKVEILQAERQRIWEQRRQEGSKSQQSREYVKSMILKMRMKSKMDPKALQVYLEQLTLSPAASVPPPTVEVEHPETGDVRQESSLLVQLGGEIREGYRAESGKTSPRSANISPRSVADPATQFTQSVGQLEAPVSTQRIQEAVSQRTAGHVSPMESPRPHVTESATHAPADVPPSTRN
jgi:hypothetical protein